MAFSGQVYAMSERERERKGLIVGQVDRLDWLPLTLLLGRSSPATHSELIASESANEATAAFMSLCCKQEVGMNSNE